MRCGPLLVAALTRVISITPVIARDTAPLVVGVPVVLLEIGQTIRLSLRPRPRNVRNEGAVALVAIMGPLRAARSVTALPLVCLP